MCLQKTARQRERKTKTITCDGHSDSHYRIREKIQRFEEWLPSQQVEEFTPKEAETVTSKQAFKMSACFITTEIKEGLSPMSQEQGLGMRKILETKNVYENKQNSHTRTHTK